MDEPIGYSPEGLRQLLAETGASKMDAATLLGVTERTVGRWLSDTTAASYRPMRPEYWRRLGLALRATNPPLLADIDPPAMLKVLQACPDIMRWDTWRVEYQTAIRRTWDYLYVHDPAELHRWHCRTPKAKRNARWFSDLLDIQERLFEQAGYPLEQLAAEFPDYA